MSKSVVPQWSAVKVPKLAKPRVPMARAKSSTEVVEGVVMHPSTSRIGMKPNKSGTGTQITTKMTQESSVLKADQFFLKIDSLFNGTNLTSDLNTPDIKMDIFDFKAQNYHNGTDLEVGGSIAANVASPGNFLSSSEEDSTSASAPANDDAKYTLIDMSPGPRDLQADHYEQRIDLEKLMGSCSIVMDPTQELNSGLFEIPLTMENYTGNGLGAQPVAQQAQSMDMPPLDPNVANDFGFSQLLVDDDSMIPKEIMEQIDSLFPEELFQDEIPCGAANSEDLDMYLGSSMPIDIISESLEQAGLHEELESMSFLDEGGLSDTANASDEFGSTQGAAKAVRFTNSTSGNMVLQPSAVNILPTQLATNGTIVSNFSTTTPSTSKSNVTVQFLQCSQSDIASTANIVQPMLTTPTAYTTPTVNVRAPSKKRKPAQEDVTPSTSTGKRLRRTAKKPLRYREPETIAEFSDFDCIDSVTQVLDRKGNDATNGILKHETITIVKHESEENEETTSVATLRRGGNESEENEETNSVATLRRGRNSDQTLTEEQKYHRIRILNNEASKRCRLKRKQTIKEMEVELDSLERRNNELKDTHKKLQELRDRVKTIVYDSLSKRFPTK